MATLRRWRETDVPEIANMERRCFGADAWTEEMLLDQLRYPFLFGLLLEENGTFLGYGCLRVMFGIADVDNIAVDLPYRGKGYGERLLTEMEALAKAQGADECLLEVRVSNAAARGLYEKHGFVEIGVRKKYYSNGENALVMRKEL